MQEKKAKKIHDAASIARLHQAVVTADKRRQSRSVEHDVRAKQTRACDAERTGLLTSIFILVTSPACWRVITYASIGAKRNLVTAPAECRGVINYLTTDGQLIVQGRLACSNPSLTASLTAVFPPVDKKREKRKPELPYDVQQTTRKFCALSFFTKTSRRMLVTLVVS